MSLTMEVISPGEHAIVHVAMVGTVTLPTSWCRTRKSSSAPTTSRATRSFSPTTCSGPGQALAARLQAAMPGDEISVFAVGE